MELENVAFENIFSENSDRLLIGLWYCVCGRGIVRWKIIHYLEGHVKVFECCSLESKDWEVPVQLWQQYSIVSWHTRV